MSFYTEVESNPRLNQLVHLPKEVRMGTANNGTIEHKSVLPPMNYFGGIQKLNPQSGFNSTTLFSSGGQIDFWLGYNGFIEQLRLSLELQVNSAAANPLTILGPYLIKYIEFYDSNQNIMQTVYADNIFLERIHWNKDKSNFENNAEGVSATYGAIGPLAASATANIQLNIPCAIADSQLKGNVIDGKILVRVYFSATGIISGAATDLFCTSATFNQHAEQLSGALESKELSQKKNRELHYRVLNPVRVASFAISNAVANQYYDIQLVSATQMSAFLYFVVRPTPITSANVQSYVQNISFELYDQSMQVQGIRQYQTSNQYVVAQKFGGDIFNSAKGNGIYVIPFAINIEKAYNGHQVGFYQMTTRETLRLYMPPALTTGNYVVDVYSMDYSEMIANRGRLDFKK